LAGCAGTEEAGPALQEWVKHSELPLPQHCAYVL
jgi:hypothetical protein